MPWESSVALAPSRRYSCGVNIRATPLEFDPADFGGTVLRDSSLPASWRGRPRSFVALMSLYESNFWRLELLAGPLRDLAGLRISHREDDCDLRLRVAERTPYTSLLELTYLFTEAGQESSVTAPDMLVRVYHDARLVEAHSWAAQHRHPLLRDWRQASQDLDQRWSRNIMLNKWLDYCVERGHSLRTET